MAYFLEFFVIVIRSDSQKVNEREQLSDIVHHRGPGEAEPCNGLEMICCFGRHSISILDALRLIENNAIKETLWTYERKSLPQWAFIDLSVKEFTCCTLLRYECIPTFILSGQSIVGGQYNVVVAQLIPRELSAPMSHVRA